MRRSLVASAVGVVSALVVGCGDSSKTSNGTAGSAGSAGDATSAAGSSSVAGSGGGSGGDGKGGSSSNAGGDAQATGGKYELPPVGACDALPSALTWENITPKGMAMGKAAVNGTVGAAIVVDPMDPGRLWLGTSQQNKEIWRSDDCGASWVQVNTGPGGFGDGKGMSGVGDGAQWSMQVDPDVAGTIFATSGYGAQGLWKTTDGGTSWKDVLQGTEYAMHAEYKFVNNVSMDPTDSKHLVVSTHGTCSAPFAPNCIAETKDGGASWSTLVAPETWVEGGGLVLVKGDLWVWCGKELMVTPDGGKSWMKGALEGGGSCEAEYTIRPFVPAADGNYYLGSRNGVIQSKDGLKWTRIPNTSGLMVMVTQGSKEVFASNQWMPSIRMATFETIGTWKDLPTPPQIAEGSDGGIPFMAFDDKHRILYASMFSGGVARMVVP